MKFTLSARPCPLHKFFDYDKFPVSVKDDTGEAIKLLSRDEVTILIHTGMIRLDDKVHEITDTQMQRLKRSLHDRGIDLERN